MDEEYDVQSVPYLLILNSLSLSTGHCSRYWLDRMHPLGLAIR
jgi:hypothetical protein